MTDVYAASEAALPGVTGQTIADGFRSTGIAVFPISRGSIGCTAMSANARCRRSGLSLGAGNIHEQFAILAAELVIAEKLKEIVGEEGDVRLFGTARETHHAAGRRSGAVLGRAANEGAFGD